MCVVTGLRGHTHRYCQVEDRGARGRLDRLPPYGSDSEVDDERPLCQRALPLRVETGVDITEKVCESKTINDDGVLIARNGYRTANRLEQVRSAAERQSVAVVIGRHTSGGTRILVLASRRTRRGTPCCAQQRSVLPGYQHQHDRKDG